MIEEEKDQIIDSHEQRLNEIKRYFYNSIRAINSAQKLKYLQEAYQLWHPYHYKGASLEIIKQSRVIFERILMRQYKIYQEEKEFKLSQETIETLSLINQNNTLVLLDQFQRGTRKFKIKALEAFRKRLNSDQQFLLEEKESYLILLTQITSLRKLQFYHYGFGMLYHALRASSLIISAITGIVYRKKLSNLGKRQRQFLFFGILGLSLITPLIMSK